LVIFGVWKRGATHYTGPTLINVLPTACMHARVLPMALVQKHTQGIYLISLAVSLRYQKSWHTYIVSTPGSHHHPDRLYRLCRRRHTHHRNHATIQGLPAVHRGGGFPGAFPWGGAP